MLWTDRTVDGGGGGGGGDKMCKHHYGWKKTKCREHKKYGNSNSK